ncbi:homoserine kinase [Oceanobacillus sp. Castelsardo]|uniref:homoserine kinase n=1 Tax=Oceanobacillus sp. Castelsardo TaxID=1851204 RepID=UPI00083839B8|nr:homoserine kinase [Oceanobacillus sp. Castelsardo]
MKSFQISVPATSANVGPGFDSIGLAVNLYLTLQVDESDQWRFIPYSPTDSNIHYEDHFIYKIAKQIADRHSKTLPPCKVTELSVIPLASGLGSSASAILAGIEIANQVCQLNLTNDDKLRYGTEIEGHPDNIAPALFGGLVISTDFGEEIVHIDFPNLELDTVVYIPNVKLKTEASRKVLPDVYPIKTAVKASGIGNLVVASLLQGDYKLAGRMMERDLFHEPYRKELIPNYDKIREEATELGAYGTILSGAGPTMISFAPTGQGSNIAKSLQKILPDYNVKALNICTDGLLVSFK